MRTALFLGTLVVAASLSSGAWAANWNANNCRWLCRAIYGSQGGAECIARHDCSQYGRGPSATRAYLRARVTIYCANHDCPGQHRRRRH